MKKQNSINEFSEIVRKGLRIQFSINNATKNTFLVIKNIMDSKKVENFNLTFSKESQTTVDCNGIKTVNYIYDITLYYEFYKEPHEELYKFVESYYERIKNIIFENLNKTEVA